MAITGSQPSVFMMDDTPVPSSNSTAMVDEQQVPSSAAVTTLTTSASSTAFVSAKTQWGQSPQPASIPAPLQYRFLQDISHLQLGAPHPGLTFPLLRETDFRSKAYEQNQMASKIANIQVEAKNLSCYYRDVSTDLFFVNPARDTDYVRYLRGFCKMLAEGIFVERLHDDSLLTPYDQSSFPLFGGNNPPLSFYFDSKNDLLRITTLLLCLIKHVKRQSNNRPGFLDKVETFFANYHTVHREGTEAYQKISNDFYRLINSANSTNVNTRKRDADGNPRNGQPNAATDQKQSPVANEGPPSQKRKLDNKIPEISEAELASRAEEFKAGKKLLEAEIAELKRKSEEAQQEYKRQKQADDAEIQRLHATAQQSKQKMDDDERAMKNYCLEQIAAIQRQYEAKLDARLRTFESQRADQYKDFYKEMQQAQTEQRQQLERLQSANASREADLKKQYEERLNAQSQIFQLRMETHKQQFDAENKKLQAEKQQAEAQLEQERLVSQNLQRQMADNKLKHDAQMEQLQEKTKQDLKQLQSESTSREEDLRKEHKTQLDQKNETIEILAKQVASGNSQYEKLQEYHKNEMADLQSQMTPALLKHVTPMKKKQEEQQAQRQQLHQAVEQGYQQRLQQQANQQKASQQQKLEQQQLQQQTHEQQPHTSTTTTADNDDIDILDPANLGPSSTYAALKSATNPSAMLDTDDTAFDDDTAQKQHPSQEDLFTTMKSLGLAPFSTIGDSASALKSSANKLDGSPIAAPAHSLTSTTKTNTVASEKQNTLPEVQEAKKSNGQRASGLSILSMTCAHLYLDEETGIVCLGDENYKASGKVKKQATDNFLKARVQRNITVESLGRDHKVYFIQSDFPASLSINSLRTYLIVLDITLRVSNKSKYKLPRLFSGNDPLLNSFNSQVVGQTIVLPTLENIIKELENKLNSLKDESAYGFNIVDALKLRLLNPYRDFIAVENSRRMTTTSSSSSSSSSSLSSASRLLLSSQPAFSGVPTPPQPAAAAVKPTARVPIYPSRVKVYSGFLGAPTPPQPPAASASQPPAVPIPGRA